MNAEAIARALGGHRAGRDWMARCPAHDDRTPSLAIREGRDGKILSEVPCRLQPVGRDRGAEGLRHLGTGGPGARRPIPAVCMTTRASTLITTGRRSR